MALTNEPAAKLIYNFKDETGNQAKAVFHVPFDTLAAVALAGADALGTLLAAMSDCRLLSYSLTYGVVDPSPGSPVAGSRIEHKGRFIWELANGLQTREEIPAIKASVVAGDGAIDLTSISVAAFVTAMVDVDALFCGVDGSDITALSGAYEAFRRSTRHMLPSRRLAV